MTKRPEEIALMLDAGKLLASVFAHLDRLHLIGMSTMAVNDLVDAFIVDTLDARPASKGQYGYAYALNASRNAVVCHGVPAPGEVLQDGDIVNFDITLEKNGYIADSSKTVEGLAPPIPLELHRFGLAATLVTGDPTRAERVSSALYAGTVWVNCFFVRDLGAPFGGNGKSGNGSRQSGIWVLDQFTRWQSLNWDYAGKLQKAQMDNQTIEGDMGFRLQESD